MPPSCRQAGCPFTQTAKCLEGFADPTTCPNYVAASDPAEAAVPEMLAAGGAPPAAAERIALPTAKALTPEMTYELTRTTVMRVIICAGEHDCGKTTLLASMYDLFQDGPVGDVNFAGSGTLHGFEQRCYAARAASDLRDPKTERTHPGEGFRFLHLRLWNAATTATTDLLLGDMSGELYRQLRDSSDECQKYDFIRRADDFSALLDGGKIASGLHAEAFGNLQALVRGLLDAGVLGAHSRISLLTTKWDLLAGSVGREALVAALEERFRENFSSRVREVTCFHVAARPDAGDEPVGLAELLTRWLAASNPLPVQPFRESPPIRAFDWYAAVARSSSPWRGAW